MNNDLVLIKEKDYENTIENSVRPYLESIKDSGFMTSRYNHQIYYEHFFKEDAKGCVLILHGFTEGIVKYSEVIYTFLMQGFEVYMIEHFGHGSSTRYKEVEADLSKVSVNDFNIYTDDVIDFTKNIIKKQSNNSSLYLFGHSMGGGIATRVIEKEPQLFNKCVLSSPMIGINMGPLPEWFAKALSGLMIKCGKAYDYVFSHHAFDDNGNFEASPDKSRERYNYFEKIKRENDRYKSNGACWNWVNQSIKATKEMKKQASKITIPVLLLQAEVDHSVKKSDQVKFSTLCNTCTIKEIKGSKHEIMFSKDDVNKEFWNEIFKFLED